MRRPVTGPKTLRRLPDGVEPCRPTRFSLTPVGITLGAHVDDVDLAEPCDDELLDELRRALLEWKVLFFSDQHLPPQQHADFAARWGVLTDDQLEPTTRENPADNLVVFTRDAGTPGLENGWHSDSTFRPMPTAGTILRAIEVPPAGGDTLFADMAAAYDDLPAVVRARLRGLVAVHDWSIGAYATKYGDRLDRVRAANPPVEHPVAIRHPATGRPTLFVNRMFTREITGLPPDEADALLDLLCAQAELPELQCRFAWRAGSVAFWDNVACQHYGASDYHPARRVMARATFFDPRYTELAPA
ncbi:MAG TPA: TauD/TfdA family dioxygenase [Acidimicrobiia bacterium]|nr:TauD/TfdA family dioxygenase [Acidimicrobiia bacterium]